MKRPFYPATGVFDAAISLKQLVHNLVDNSQPAAASNNTYLVNEVRLGIKLGKAMHKAIAVIKDILRTVVANSRNGEIHITAKQSRNMLILEVEERNNYNGYALAFSIGTIEQDAASAGGHISIKGPQQRVTTISFRFPNHRAA